MQSNSHSIAITLTKFFLIPEWTWPSGCNCVLDPPPPLLIETLFHSSSAANKKNYYTLIFVKSREICFWCEYLTVLSFFFLSFGLVYDRNKMTLAWRQTIYFHCHMTCVILIPFSQESFYSLAKLIRSKLEWKAYSGDWNAPFPFVYRHRMSSNSSCIHSFIRS